MRVIFEFLEILHSFLSFVHHIYFSWIILSRYPNELEDLKCLWVLPVKNCETWVLSLGIYGYLGICPLNRCLSLFFEFEEFQFYQDVAKLSIQDSVCLNCSWVLLKSSIMLRLRVYSNVDLSRPSRRYASSRSNLPFSSPLNPNKLTRC